MYGILTWELRVRLRQFLTLSRKTTRVKQYKDANLSVDFDVRRRNNFNKILVHDGICEQTNSPTVKHHIYDIVQ